MAKYYGKQVQAQGPKRKLPLALFALAGALVLIVAGLIVLTRSAPAAGGTAVANGARVAVDQEKLDFGKVKMNTPVRAAFRVKNAGNQPLQILGQPLVRVVEGC